jgi:hypothetical protein
VSKLAQADAAKLELAENRAWAAAALAARIFARAEAVGPRLLDYE